MEKDNQRTRHWGFIAYPDSVRENWKDILSELGVQAVISPLHDKDLTEDGKLKKPHWHVALIFDGVKSQKQIEQITQALVVDGTKGYLPVRILSLRGTIRYFAHIDDPKKAQYDFNDIEAIGGVDYTSIAMNKEDVDRQESCNISQVIAIINDNKLCDFAVLADFLITNDNLDGFNILRKNSYFFGQYLKSKKFFNNPLDTENKK